MMFLVVGIFYASAIIFGTILLMGKTTAKLDHLIEIYGRSKGMRIYILYHVILPIIVGTVLLVYTLAR